jgi:hypothetical protein
MFEDHSAYILSQELNGLLASCSFSCTIRIPAFFTAAIQLNNTACFQSVGYSVDHLSQDCVLYALSKSSVLKDCPFHTRNETKQPTTTGLMLFSFYPAYRLQFHASLKLYKTTNRVT